jgi:hypothetical protein
MIFRRSCGGIDDKPKPKKMKTFKSFKVAALLCGVAAFAIVGCSSDRHMHSASTDAYPLTKCVVSGEDLGDKPYTFVRNGQTVKLCCKDCLAKFDKDADKYMAKLSAPK